MQLAQIAAAVRLALAEDVGPGDLTAACVPPHTRCTARVVSRERAVLCGTAWFDSVFAQLDPGVRIYWRAADGDRILAEQAVCELSGPARAVLTGERTALNFIQMLSATATVVRAYADALAGFDVALLDTRKTIPGLRDAQKYAVRCGGGRNHRRGLYDAVLIKENHITVFGSVHAALAEAQAKHPDGVPIEIEVEDLAELEEALAAGADAVLLDNFDTSMLRQAVAIGAGRARLEVSGGVTLDNVREIAATGVDAISIGALTKNVEAIDFSMRIIET